VADPIPSGSDVTSSTDRCTECGQTLEMGSAKSIPPCPNCENEEWEALSGGDSAADHGSES
jgi:predicted  nucleic acid-binding Zn-ribbon protein